MIVSIHAPARGATRTATNRVALSIGFQFTRPRGARLAVVRQANADSCFNSRAREGRDWRRACWISVLPFQFTRPRGARLDWHPLLTAMDWFQFTRPRGARRKFWIIPDGFKRFNSRAREGRDLHIPFGSPPRRFQFTRPRGARQFLGPMLERASVSIHAPARGATGRGGTQGEKGRFQFTRPRGARHAARRSAIWPEAFQFTRPRGARPSKTGAGFSAA